MSLPGQVFKIYREIDYDNIMYLYDYHPWNRNGEKNPHIDQITHDILNIKNPNDEKANYRNKAVRFFKNSLTSHNPPSLLSLIDIQEDRLFAIVPSSTAYRVCKGMTELVNELRGPFSFINEQNILVRHATVPKAATGGLRDQRVHLNSIRVDPRLLDGKSVFLFDDVTTTGCSLLACKKLLLDAGAAKVAMIALGQTYMES